jgi:hypothetical protein
VNTGSQDVWVLTPQSAAPPAVVALDVRAALAGAKVKITFRTETQVGLASINILADRKSGPLNVISMPPKPGDAGASYELLIPRKTFKSCRTVMVQTVMADGRTFDSAPARF